MSKDDKGVALNEQHNSTSTGGKKLVKISDKCEVYKTKTMYNTKRQNNNNHTSRDSGCYVDENQISSLNLNTRSNKTLSSSKAVEKKAQLLQKKRIHSKSCSFTFEELDNELGLNNKTEGDHKLSSSLSGLQLATDASASGKTKKKNKKNGAKLFWGEPGDELWLESGDTFDDRNYDSQDEPVPEFSFYSRKPAALSSVVEFDRLVSVWIQEFFQHFDTSEVVALLQERAPAGTLLQRLPYLAISLSLDQKPRERELVSQLLSALCDGRLLDHRSMDAAFKLLLQEQLSDLTTDIPEAPEMVGSFIARSVADDLLAPAFVTSALAGGDDPLMQRAMKQATALLRSPHAYARLDEVWLGPARVRSLHELTARPTRLLSKAFNTLLKEYLNARDKHEIETTFRELDCPHFLHEFVLLLLQLACENGTESCGVLLVDLLAFLHTTGQISGEMICQGVRRFYQQLADFCLDVPTVYLSLDRLLKLAVQSGCVSEALVREMPKKRRSRFISECPPRRISLTDLEPNQCGCVNEAEEDFEAVNP